MYEATKISELSNELTYHRYMLNQGQMGGLFKDITIPEYIALHGLARSVGENDGRAYLSDIADELRLTVPQTSKMIRGLRGRGLVSWSHDGDGSEGTYITVTESGLGLIERQEAVLKDYYRRVIEKFGAENMIAFLNQMKSLEEIMDAELKEEDNG